jgi:hypothetical protein
MDWKDLKDYTDTPHLRKYCVQTMHINIYADYSHDNMQNKHIFFTI